MLAQDNYQIPFSDEFPSGDYSILEDESKLWFSGKVDGPIFKLEKQNFIVGYFDGFNFYTKELTTVSEGFYEAKIANFVDLGDKLYIQLSFPMAAFIIDKATLDIQWKMIIEYSSFELNCDFNGEFLIYPQILNKDELAIIKTDFISSDTILIVPHVNPLKIITFEKSFVINSDYCEANRYDYDGKFIEKYSPDYFHLTSLQNGEEHCIAMNTVLSKEKQHIVTVNGQLKVFDDQKDHFTNAQGESANYKKVYKLDREGNYIYESAAKINETSLFLVNRDTVPIGFQSTNLISDIHSNNYKDHFWVSTDSGFELVKQNKIQVKNLIPGQSLRAIYPISDDQLICGKATVNSLDIINRKSLRIEKEYYKDYRKSIFPSYFFHQYQGYLWTMKNGDIIALDENFEVVQSYEVFKDNVINAVAIDKDIIYLSSQYDLRSFNLATHQIKIVENKEDRNRYVTNYMGILADSLLIMASENGLLSYNLHSGNKQTIRDNVEYTSLLIKQNQLIAARINGKIETYNFHKNSFQIQDSAFVNTTVFNMSYDQKKRLWLGTLDGVMLEKESNTNQFIPIDAKILSNKEANRYSIYFDSIYNKMYIGTVSGLDVFNTDFDYQNDEFEINLANYQYYKNDTLRRIYTTSEKEVSSLTIPYNKRYLQLRLSSDKITKSKNLQFEYQLDNGDDWLQQNTKNVLTFPTLSGGKHQIRIRGLDSNNLYSSNELTIAVYVGKYFFETWWFRCLLLVTISGLIYLWFRRIKEENIRLEKEVENRTKELRDDKEIIEQQALDLKSLDKMKNQFFSNISHELKTPLTLIKSPISQLQQKDLDQETNYYLSLIHSNAEFLEERVNELLDLARLQNSKVKLQNNSLDISALLSTICTRFESSFKEKSIVFNVVNTIPEMTVVVDRVKFEKVFHNLLSNALKFTPKGGRVDAKFHVNGENELIAEISDNGIGIKDEHISKLFDRFYQVPNDESNANPGTGIGLSMVKEYIELMNGSIDVKSQYGVGSTFIIQLPLISNSEEEEVSKEEDIKSETKPYNEIFTPKNAPKILIAEDNPQLREYIAHILSKSFEVYQAKNGKHALEKLHDGLKVDLILSDVMMPEMDGTSLLKAVRSQEHLKTLPFIFLTAKTNHKFILDSYRIGVDDYLTKPFSEEELLARIGAVYRNYLIRIQATGEELNEDSPITEVVEEISELEQKLQKIILDNLHHPEFSTSFIGEQMGISRRTLQRILKKEIGLTPKQYIREIQLNLARDLVQEQQYQNITSLAKQVGFSNPTYFKNIYFERFGVELK